MRQLLLILAFLVQSFAALAQTTVLDPISAAEYDQWEVIAARADDAVIEARASNAAFEQLRSELVDWRARFNEARAATSPQLEALQDQLAALGPAPEEGKTEPDAVATRRAALESQINEMEAPKLAAEAAYTRANNLIGRIDGVIRDRQASEFLQLGPSPLNPANWPGALTAVMMTGRAILTEIHSVWGNEILAGERRENLPVTVLFLLVAVVALTRGRRWIVFWTERVDRHLPPRARTVNAFVSSLLRMLVTVLGILSFVAAIESLNILGYRGEELVGTLVNLAILYSLAGWIGAHVFSRHDRHGTLLTLGSEHRREGRFYVRAIAVLVWAFFLIRDVAGSEQYTDAARAVLQFPVAALLGLILVRLGGLIRHGARDIADDEATHDYRRTLLRNLGRITLVAAVISVAAAAIGYISVPRFVLIPAVQTLGLIGVLVILQHFLTALYGWILGRDDEAIARALGPVLIGLVLAVLSLPIVALIWGARQSDLSETWGRFLEGFSIGDARISPTDFLTFAVVFGIGYVLTRVLQGTLRATVLPKTRIDPGGQNAIVSGLGYVGIFLAALLAITTTGIDLSSLAIVAGALSVGIGFGLQNIVSNFVAGIIMLIERPVAIGDWIEVGGHSGIVKDISVRSTRIETFDKIDVIVPNSDFIAGAVQNWTRYSQIGRVILPVKVAHGNDSRQVEAILMDIAESHPGVSARHKPTVVLVSIDDAMKFEIRAIIKDVNQMLGIKSDFAHEVLRRFGQANLVAPIPQQEVFVHDLRDRHAAVADKTDEVPEASPDDKPA